MSFIAKETGEQHLVEYTDIKAPNSGDYAAETVQDNGLLGDGSVSANEDSSYSSDLPTGIAVETCFRKPLAAPFSVLKAGL